MQLGMIGLGRMGANMVRRLMRAGHECVVYDMSAENVQALAREGATGAGSIDEFVSHLAAPRAVWLMLPAGVVDGELAAITPLLQAGDIVIDGGNSYYHDDIRRATELQANGLHYVDVGVSGGVWGLERGYCLMIGGEDTAVQQLDPIFAALAPGVEAAPRTPGREKIGAAGDSATPIPAAPNATAATIATGPAAAGPGANTAVGAAERGYLHCGPNGAGHFVKMVHNGIEYGIMAAYAEGFNILHNADVGTRTRATDAETAPLLTPEYYRYTINLPDVAEVWRRGSVIGSWLLDLTASALLESPDMATFGGRVSDSGEGRWTLAAAVDEGVPAPVLSAALFGRFASRGDAGFADRLLSAMRKQFGGHVEKPTGE